MTKLLQIIAHIFLIFALANVSYAAVTRDTHACVSASKDQIVKLCSAVIDDPLQSRTNKAEALLNRGAAYFIEKNYAKAIADLSMVVDIQPDNITITALLIRGKAYAALNDRQNAISDFGSVIKKDPANSTAFLDRGIAYFNNKQLHEAIADFNEKIELEPKNAVGFNWRGAAFNHQKEYTKAIADFDTAIKLRPDYENATFNRNNAIAALINRGQSHRGRGEFDKAIVDFSAAIKFKPDDPQLYFLRGESFFAFRQNYDRAISDFNIAIKLDPNFIDGYKFRGLAKQGSNKLNEAVADFTQVIRIHSFMPDGYMLRGLAYFRMKEFEKALSDSNKVIELGAKTDSNFNNRGANYLALGKFELALPDFNEAIRLNPRYAQPLRHRAEVKLLSGDFKGAREDLTQAQGLSINVLDSFVLLTKIVKAENAAAQAQLPETTENRVALVIGNNKYRNFPDYMELKKAVNDARLIRETLQTKLGFNVVYGEDVDFDQMKSLVDRFTNGIKKGDVAFVYYSGHGVSDKGATYMLPGDVPRAKLGEEARLIGNGIDATALTSTLVEKGARVVVAVLDACRDDIFTLTGGKSIGGRPGLPFMDGAEGVFVMYSAATGQAALDRLSDEDPNPNSVYTRTLAPLLSEKNLTLEQIAKRVKQDVAKLAESIGEKQRPAYYNDITDDVVLNK